MTAATEERGQRPGRTAIVSGVAATALLVMGTMVSEADETVPPEPQTARSVVRVDPSSPPASSRLREMLPRVARSQTAVPAEAVEVDEAPDDVETSGFTVWTAERQAEAPRPLQVPEPAPEPEPEPDPTPAVDPSRGEMWDRVARCESGYGGEPKWDIDNKPHLDPYDEARFFGGLQFNKMSWDWAVEVGGHDVPAWPHEATRAQQIAVAETLLDIHPAGWGAWPVCSRKVGLR